jgi:DNA helicase IV
MNEKQQLAVTTLGNVLLIAGAGSGKTFTIINKINYLIENNLYKENEILAISFTNESVNDIKRKIKYNIDVKTFHKLALDLIRDDNTKIAKESTLTYLIKEYINKPQNKRQKKIIRKILLENTKNNLINLISTFINLYKANYSNIDYLIFLYKNAHFITKDYLLLIIEIYLLYQNELSSSGYLDFNDMINIGTVKINNNEVKTKYKFVIIDEFQDTSLIRFNLIKAIINQNKGYLFAVGDDYQSIYRFSGCDLKILINLKDHLENLTIINLDYNYRNNQTLVNIANNFIMKNKKQIKKNTICLKDTEKPVKIVFYKNEKTCLEKIIKLIDGPILILGRNNKDKETFNVSETDNIKFLTIHKSKGLEEDNIIIVNLLNITNSLPSKIKNQQIINLLSFKETIPYEEERRLFYVALTRTRNSAYLLVPYHNYSLFVKELIKENKKDLEVIKL